MIPNFAYWPLRSKKEMEKETEVDFFKGCENFLCSINFRQVNLQPTVGKASRVNGYLADAIGTISLLRSASTFFSSMEGMELVGLAGCYLTCHRSRAIQYCEREGEMNDCVSRACVEIWARKYASFSNTTLERRP